LTATGTAVVNEVGGIVRGGGTLSIGASSFTNHGSITPGTSPGLLTVAGALTQAAEGVLAIELGGTAAGSQYDRLSVTGAVALDGALDVSRINGFSPALGQSFVVLTWGSRTGTFTALTGLDLGGGLALQPSYGATGLTLTVVSSP